MQLFFKKNCYKLKKKSCKKKKKKRKRKIAEYFRYSACMSQRAYHLKGQNYIFFILNGRKGSSLPFLIEKRFKYSMRVMRVHVNHVCPGIFSCFRDYQS